MTRKLSLWENGLAWEVWVDGQKFQHRPIPEGPEDNGRWRDGLPLGARPERVLELARQFEGLKEPHG